MYEDTPGFQVTRFAKDPTLAGTSWPSSTRRTG